MFGMNADVAYRHSRVGLASVLMLQAGTVGCDNDLPCCGVPVTESIPGLTVPEAAEIAIDCFYQHHDIPPIQFAVTTKEQRDKIVEAIRELRWSNSGSQLEEISMRHPDIDILLTGELGKLRTYRLFWRGDGFVDEDSMQLLTVDNIIPLRNEVTAVTKLTSYPSLVPAVTQPASTQ